MHKAGGRFSISQAVRLRSFCHITGPTLALDSGEMEMWNWLSV